MNILGTLYGVGVGPGDPELLTLQAVRVLQSVPVIAYPTIAPGRDSYALQIAKQHIAAGGTDLLELIFPATTNPHRLGPAWIKAADAIRQQLAAGRDVAFITEGDPAFYSTFTHIRQTIQQQHQATIIKIVPGISAASAAAATLGIHLALWDESFAIVAARDDYQAMKQALVNHQGIVFIKVSKVIGLITEVVRELGLLQKATVLTQVTSDREVICPLAELPPSDLSYFTLVVVRK